MVKKKIITIAAAICLCFGTAAAPVESGLALGGARAYAAVYQSDTVAQYAEQVARLVNEQRAAQGLAPLKLSDELCDAANVRAKEIRSVFSHTRPNGKSCFTALKEKGISYTYAAENIAYGQRTPEAVMASWMNSSGHRANILSKKAEYIGIGVTYQNGTYYWTQFFASGKGMTGNAAAEPSTQTTASGNNCKGSACKTGKTAYLDTVCRILKKLGYNICK